MDYFLTHDGPTVTGGVGFAVPPEPLPAGLIPCTPEQYAGWRDLAVADGAIVPAPPGPARLMMHLETCLAAILAEVWTFDVALPGQPAHPVTTRLDPTAESRMHSIDRWSQEHATDQDARLPYWGVREAPTGLNPAEAASLASQALAVGVRGFGLATQAVQAITASPPTITTLAEVEAALGGLAPAA